MSKLYKQLSADEGNIPHAYQDPLGYWTIGVGILIDKRKGGGLRPEEVEYIFQNRLKIVTAELQRKISWFGKLSDARQAVLINMAYQMGVEGLLGFRNTLRTIASGDYAKGAREMLQSKWATQTPERALRMSKQMASGEWQ